MAAAERVFFTHGYDRTSVNELRREAGVSKGTIYAYFDSKEALFRALCDEIHDRVFVGLINTHPTEESDREWLLRFGIAFACLMTGEPAIAAGRTVIAVADRMSELCEAFFESGFQRGLAILTQFLSDRETIPGLDVPHAARSLLELFLSGIHRERLLGLMSEQDAHAQVPETVARAIAIACRRT
ncbi:MAG: hypothetical protein BGP09_24760 [Rhizobium sp. 60-20]|nr:MAG: hypothetical protein BGP09_24760 [Rhizobium sp. 60-20]